MKKIVRIILVLILIMLGWSFYYYPYEYGRLWHLVDSDQEVYRPIILEPNAKLTESSNFTFDLNFNHYDYHDIGLIFDEGTVHSSFSETSSPYAFQGKVIVELISNGNVVRKTTVTKPLSYKFEDGNLGYYKSMVLDRFPLPFKGRYAGFKLRLTILEADPVLEGGDVDIYLSVSTKI